MQNPKKIINGKHLYCCQLICIYSIGLLFSFKGSCAGTMKLCYFLFVVMNVRLIMVSTSKVLYCNATVDYHHVMRSLKETKITTYSNEQMYSNCYAYAHAINCRFMFNM